jgi:hypothetical protein
MTGIQSRVSAAAAQAADEAVAHGRACSKIAAGLPPNSLAALLASRAQGAARLAVAAADDCTLANDTERALQALQNTHRYAKAAEKWADAAHAAHAAAQIEGS